MQLSNYEFGEHLKSSIYLVYTTACLGFQQIYLLKNLLAPYFLACCWHSRVFACLSFQQKICLCSNIWAIRPFHVLLSSEYWLIPITSACNAGCSSIFVILTHQEMMVLISILTITQKLHYSNVFIIIPIFQLFVNNYGLVHNYGGSIAEWWVSFITMVSLEPKRHTPCTHRL